MDVSAGGHGFAHRDSEVGMVYRLTFPLIAAILVLLIAAAEARGGTYVVRECHNSAPVNRFHEAIAQALPDPGPYSVSADWDVCGRASHDFALQVTPTRTARNGQYGRLRFVAPTGTRFVAVKVDAKLRREDGHKSRLIMASAAGVPKVRVGTGLSKGTAFKTYRWSAGGGSGHAQLIAILICDRSGSDCPNSGGHAKIFIRDLVLTVSDELAPTVSLGGALLDGGWQRGTLSLDIEGRDEGGGLRTVTAKVNGSKVISKPSLPCDLIPGTADAARLAPCSSFEALNESLNTAESPFTDGLNELKVCASDYGAGANKTCRQLTITVDNTAPEVAFRRSQDPDDPELIRAPASDATSGLDLGSARISYRRVGDAQWLDLPTSVIAGELRARVNSDAMPPGDYEFRARVADVAGNEAASTERRGGGAMVLSFPLKEPVRLGAELGNGEDSQVVRYRKPGEVSGRLVDSEGAPIAGEEVEVVQRFAPGSLLDRRTTTTSTDAQGRYRAPLPGGPSRDVEVHYDGSQRYARDSSTRLDFDVLGKASLRVSRRRVRAGRKIAFRGRVKRYFARIPPGGKLVEFQVRSGRRWTTLHEAKGTNRKGKVAIRHRFRGFYTRPVTFVFRLKATRENGWPYRGAAISKRRRVTVVPKKR